MTDSALKRDLSALIVEASEDAIVGMSLDGTIVSWNAGAVRMLGRDAGAAIGRGFALLFPGDGAADARSLLDRVRRGERVRDDRVLERADGGRVEVSLDVFPVGAGGRISGAAAIAREVAARKALEEKLREGHVLESLGRLAGGIAHDFNNLLTVVMGNASVLKGELDPASKLWEFVDDIELAAQRAADLAGQMLAYSGRGVFVMQRTDLNALVREMAELLRVSMPKDVEVRYELAAALPKVEADVTQLRQVVMNLVINASQAIGEREGMITLGTKVARAGRDFLSGCAHAEDLPEGDYVHFTVADTGSGMDAATQAKIFAPFFTTKRAGRGLGLAAVLGIVRGHKGAIRVDSEPGMGTVFTVLFPAGASLAPRAAGAAAAPADSWRGRGTVLVVDDEEGVRAFARTALEKIGFRVVTAADGQDGIEALRKHAADTVAVLLDLTMPRLSGNRALPELRKIRPGAKVIVISGYNEAEAIKSFDGGVVDAFLKKPFTMDVLRVVLRKLLEGARG